MPPVPVIDVGGLTADTVPPEVARAVDRACREVGFFSVVGHGIDPEHIHRIYDPFFTTKGSHKGTGLGLSVTYGIIQEHGGAIKVFSRPGGGTRFHLEFPPVTAKSRKPATV